MGADEMAPWGKVPVTKADDLNLIFRTQAVEEKELTPTNDHLSPQVHQGVCVCVCAHIPKQKLISVI